MGVTRCASVYVLRGDVRLCVCWRCVCLCVHVGGGGKVVATGGSVGSVACVSTCCEPLCALVTLHAHTPATIPPPLFTNHHVPVDPASSSPPPPSLSPALRYLHSKHIAHCDLSLENVLVRQSTLEICVIDFGLAVATDGLGHSEELMRRPACGKMQYLAPEVCVHVCIRVCSRWLCSLAPQHAHTPSWRAVDVGFVAALAAQAYTRVHLNGFYLDYWSFAIMLWMKNTQGTCLPKNSTMWAPPRASTCLSTRGAVSSASPPLSLSLSPPPIPWPMRALQCPW